MLPFLMCAYMSFKFCISPACMATFTSTSSIRTLTSQIHFLLGNKWVCKRSSLVRSVDTSTECTGVIITKKGCAAWTFCIYGIYQSVEMNAGEQRGIMSVWQRWIGRKNKEGGFITVMTAPSLRNLHSCNRPKVKGSHCERCSSFASAI